MTVVAAIPLSVGLKHSTHLPCFCDSIFGRSWQGNSNETRHEIVGGTTILEGFQQIGGEKVSYSLLGVAADGTSHDVAIVVVGEFPYAETIGDNFELTLDGYDIQAINNALSAGIDKAILVIVSGRPLIIPDDILSDFDAVVAAWLPGTEGDGVAQMLYGQYDFTGKLPFSWPRSIDQVLNGFVGDNPNVLFEFGYGLDMASTTVEFSSPVRKWFAGDLEKRNGISETSLLLLHYLDRCRHQCLRLQRRSMIQHPPLLRCRQSHLLQIQQNHQRYPKQHHR
jgi:hypothetical protein